MQIRKKMMHHDNEDLEPAKILWTGGWDSTFQLLRLLFLENRPVEPYYLINEDRPSTGTELLTMKRIRQGISKMNESGAGLIQPTKYFSVSQIPSHSEITRAYQAIKNTRFIGSQYDWLARFCEYQEITRLQLCIHEDDKAAVVVAPMIAKNHGTKDRTTLGDQCFGTDEHLVFRYFEFPIFDLTKTDMAKIAKERGWSEIMKMTWFCHRPINGEPCGRCPPCRYTIEEGFGWRIPTHRRLTGNIHRLSQLSKKLAKRILIELRKNG
ncbi:MAG: 7-cyano-7-deazaguanine synthase [Desulfurivibrionaceae bacterium]